MRTHQPPITIAALVVASIAALAILPVSASAQEPPPDAPSHRPVLTVLDFETRRTGWVPPPQLGATLADLLGEKLVASGEYRVFDRQWLGDAAMAGQMPAPPQLRDQALLAGVDYLVVGSVMRFSNETRNRTFGGAGLVPLGVGSRKLESDAVIGLTIRVIDARTGELVTSTTSQGKATRKKRSLGLLSLIAGHAGVGGFSTSAVGSREAMLDEALQQAVEQAGALLARAAAQMRRQVVSGADDRRP
jgi:curli biogenesis system outer membrane secretion channel CsgG